MTASSPLPIVEGPLSTSPSGRWSKLPREVARSKLTGSERTLYDCLIDLTPIGGDKVRATEKSLAQAIGKSTKTIRRAKRGLIAKGLVDFDLGRNFVIVWAFKRPVVDAKNVPWDGTKMSPGMGQKCPLIPFPPTTPYKELERETNERPRGTVRLSIFREPGPETAPLPFQGEIEEPFPLPPPPPPPPPPPGPPSLLERARDIFGPQITQRDIAVAVREAGGGQLGLEIVDGLLLVIEGGEFVPDGFGYLISQCRKFQGIGLPKEPPALPARHNYNPLPKQEPPTPVVPLSAAEVATLVERTRSRGPEGRHAQAELAMAIKGGWIPEDLLPHDPEPAQKKPAEGHVRKNPPQPARASELADTSVHVPSTEVSKTCSAKHQTVRPQRARKDSNLQPSDSKSEGRTDQHTSVDAGHVGPNVPATQPQNPLTPSFIGRGSNPRDRVSLDPEKPSPSPREP